MVTRSSVRARKPQISTIEVPEAASATGSVPYYKLLAIQPIIRPNSDMSAGDRQLKDAHEPASPIQDPNGGPFAAMLPLDAQYNAVTIAVHSKATIYDSTPLSDLHTTTVPSTKPASEDRLAGPTIHNTLCFVVVCLIQEFISFIAVVYSLLPSCHSS